MTLPPIDGALALGGPMPAGDRDRERTKLARKWAYLLSRTSYLMFSHAELETRLGTQVGLLADLLHTEPFDAASAAAVGHELIDWRCTDPECLRSSTSVLGKGLLALSETRTVTDAAERVVAVLGALAVGFTERLREFVIDQQESMTRALRKAVQNAERELRDSEARFDRVSTCSPSGIAITDLAGRFLRTNDALHRMLGEPLDQLSRRSLFEVVPPERAESLRAFYVNLASGQGNPRRQLLRLQREDGSIATVSMSASALRDGDGQPSQAVLVIEDMSELTLLQDELLRQALHDLLTGLPNRQYFTTRLEEVVHRADPAHGITLLLLDLDAFSLVAAGLGRRVSEALLIHVADRLKSVVDGEVAMVARFEGDEFAILIENTDHTAPAGRIAERINEELAVPVTIEGNALAISASIGVVDRPPLGDTPAQLLGAAEMSMRRAQRSSGRRWEPFDAEADETDRQCFRLAAGMAAAWETGALHVAYQPFVGLVDGQPVGVEALLRWQHPQVGLLDHERCVGLAQHTGLTLPLGTWRLRAACACWHERRWRLPLHLGLTANQSANPDLVDAVLSVLSDADLDAGLLGIGVPTSALLAGGQPLANLTALAEAGLRTVAVDFGAVPADLVDLAALPVSAVRLARWSPGAADPGAHTVLRGLIDAVHDKGVTVIVDGVDDGADADRWRYLGADVAQGEAFAPVGSPEQVAALLIDD